MRNIMIAILIVSDFSIALSYIIEKTDISKYFNLVAISLTNMLIWILIYSVM